VTSTRVFVAAALIMPGAWAQSALNFVPIAPCRVTDTRNANGPFGGPVISGENQPSRYFVIPESGCGVPSTAAAYSLNIAVVPTAELGYLTVWPFGQFQPLAATLNSLDGRIKSNAAIVPAGANGAINVFATNQTDVILDINGYFVPETDAAALVFYPLRPCRIADTRDPAAPLGGPSLAAQSTRSFPIRESKCGLPLNSRAYSLNFAAVPKGPLGYLTAWPAGQPQPLVASLNAVTGTITANAVIVPAGANGDVDVFASNDTDLVIDINGYFAPRGPGGLSLYPVSPCRVLDTRLPPETPPVNQQLEVNVTASSCGVPAAAQAFVFNATVVPPGPLGYLTMWPQGQPQPLVATLNAVDGAIASNLGILPTTNGSITVFPSNPTHLILDVFGFFATYPLNLSTISLSNINVPGSRSTAAYGINSGGQIVGAYGDQSFHQHGFLDTEGTFSAIDVPEARFTNAQGINGSGHIVGYYFDATSKQHGFLDIAGVFSTIDVPGAKTTEPRGINSGGQIVGAYGDLSGKGHGFLATPTTAQSE
jgi:hypothetical protein